MTAVLQIVKSARVIADGEFSGEIGHGLYILLGVEKDDDEQCSFVLAEKISKLRIFSDENDKLNLSCLDISGEVLVVSNFTLNANYSHGNRPDYLNSASPDVANKLYLHFVEEIKKKFGRCETGVFGAYMETEMITDGPITIVMSSDVLLKKGKQK